MIYDYFFIKCVFRWSENSVRFENLMGIGFQKGQILSVRNGMYGLRSYEPIKFHTLIIIYMDLSCV